MRKALAWMVLAAFVVVILVVPAVACGILGGWMAVALYAAIWVVGLAFGIGLPWAIDQLY